MMETARSGGLQNSAIDPAFANAITSAPAIGHADRREYDWQSSPLIESFAARHVVEQRSAFMVFPTARPELLFHFGDSFRVRDHDQQPWRHLPHAALLGPRRRRYWQSAGPRIDWFLIQLSPLGCRRYLGRPFGSWWNTDATLSDIWGALADDLHEQLASERDFGRRVQLATDVLTQLALDRNGDPAISQLALLTRAGRMTGIADMALHVGVGERRLRQRFAAEYGMPPKTYLNLMRFNRQMLDVHPLYASSEQGGTDYADQSHAIHEFRRFAGMTPGAYARIKAGGDTLIVTGPPHSVDS